jgi:acetylglutamate synthase
MGLRDLAKNLATTAINNISGDIAVTVTYRQKAIGAYDPASDTYNTTPTDTVVKAVPVREKRDEDDNSRVIDATIRVLIPSSALSFIPVEQDEIILDTVVHEVVQIKTDPATALWILYLRKP